MSWIFSSITNFRGIIFLFSGSLGVWNTIHPWLGGIGISSCIVTFFVALYYNVIITWCFYYLLNSLQVCVNPFYQNPLVASKYFAKNFN